MAVVEDIELRVTVNGTAAQKGLDETRKAAESMGGRIGTLGEAMKGFQQKLGPAAAAISGVSAALGQTNGEAGKALAAIGQVAAAFAAGGPFGAALAAGTYAVDALSAAWEKELKAQDAALTKQYATLDAAVSRLTKAKGELDTIIQQAKPPEWRISEEEKRKLAEVDAVLAANQAKAAELADKVKTEAREAELKGLDLAIKKNLEERQVIMDTANAQRKALRDVEADRASAEFRARMKAEADKKREEAKAAGERAAQARREVETVVKERREDPTLSFRPFAYKEEQRRIARELQLETMAEEENQLKAMRENEKERTRIAQEATDERLRLGLEAAQKHQEIVRQEYEAVADTMTSALGVMTSATQDYVDAKIKGEEDAEAAFAAAIMRQAGQALISYGTQAIGRGILELSSPITAPLAAGSFAAGGALIAGGVALGGAATAVMHTAAGGTIGQPLPNSTSGGGGDMAARARPARPGTAGAGGANLTIIYGGLSGPSADDGARALGKGLDRARRRGIV